LNTDITATNAMVLMATPTIEIRDRIVMKFCFFLLRKYLPAMKELVFTG
jgi:hypothetical protein